MKMYTWNVNTKPNQMKSVPRYTEYTQISSAPKTILYTQSMCMVNKKHPYRATIVHNYSPLGTQSDYYT